MRCGRDVLPFDVSDTSNGSVRRVIHRRGIWPCVELCCHQRSWDGRRGTSASSPLEAGRHRVTPATDRLGRQHGDLERLIRRRELTRVHRGVFVNHTGTLSWEQRAWAAVLALEPAALCFESAMPGGHRNGPVHIAVSAQRVTPRYQGVVVHRMIDLDLRVNWKAGPPSVWPAEATLDVAAQADDEAAAFAAIALAIQSRQVWPSSLREALEGQRRIPRRRLLSALIDDVATGQHSVLERGFAALERAHGLPQADRQAVSKGVEGAVHRDVVYSRYGIIVELDGQAFHASTRARDRDAGRDLDAAAEGLTTSGSRTGRCSETAAARC